MDQSDHLILNPQEMSLLRILGGICPQMFSVAIFGRNGKFHFICYSLIHVMCVCVCGMYTYMYICINIRTHI